MRASPIVETFHTENLHTDLRWMHPPREWRIDPMRKVLVVRPEAATDFWQRTHYGFRIDNGHFLYTQADDLTVISARFRAFPWHQYDQAGLLLRFSSDCWLKTSVEFEEGSPSQMGAVVTRDGYSDWSLQDFPYGTEFRYCLRVRREANDYLVEHAAGEEGPWHLMRMAHLEPLNGEPLLAGCYACSPKEAGYAAEIADLKIL